MVETSAVLRQWLLLRAIAAGGGESTIKSLVAATGMSDKTIRRDVILLRQVGFPVTERSGEFGRKTFSMTVSSLPHLAFAFDEALALYLCRRAAVGYAGTFVEQSLQAAFRKIHASLGPRVVAYVDTMLARIAQTQLGGDYVEKGALLDRLFIAIEEDRAVFLTYRSQRSTEAVSYDIYPYRLIDHRGSLYLFGFSRDHGECRTWKVDRMEKVDLTEFHFPRPDESQIAAQLSGSFGIFHGHGEIEVRVKFAASAARYVSEKRMHASQRVEIQSDGSAVVTFRLSNTTEVKSWILSFGAAAEVLEPEGLREEIVRELQNAALLYGGKTLREQKPKKTRAR